MSATTSSTNLDFLKKLGLKQANHGTSTGAESVGSRKSIKSVSPVDGAFIGSVSVTTR
jgi:aldehyde dehydrogenase (NAD+)